MKVSLAVLLRFLSFCILQWTHRNVAEAVDNGTLRSADESVTLISTVHFSHEEFEMVSVVMIADRKNNPEVKSILEDYWEDEKEERLYAQGPGLGRCGLSIEQDSRIIGGEFVPNDGLFPWTVSLLLLPGSWMCGGSLLSDIWILTAGHCLRHAVEQVVVTIGTHDLDSGRTLPSKQTVERVEVIASTWFQHPSYGKDNKYANDIALVRIPSLLTVKPDFMPLCVPSKRLSLRDEQAEAIAVGWGRTVTGGATSRVLKYILTQTLTSDTCRSMSKIGQELITDKMLCIDPKGGAETVCHGDSGGPLFKKVGGAYYQIGLTSFGDKTCESGEPPKFTRILKYLDFICSSTGICP